MKRGGEDSGKMIEEYGMKGGTGKEEHDRGPGMKIARIQTLAKTQTNFQLHI